MAFRIGKFVTKNKPDNPMGLHKIATKLAEHPTDYELAHKLIMDGTTGNAFVSRSSSSTKIGKILASQGHTLHAHGIAQRFITYKQYSNAAHIATSIISNNIKKENSENDRYERKFQLRMAINILNAIPFNQNNLNSIVEIIKALTEAGDEQSITEALNYCDRLQRKTPKKATQFLLRISKDVPYNTNSEKLFNYIIQKLRNGKYHDAIINIALKHAKNKDFTIDQFTFFIKWNYFESAKAVGIGLITDNDAEAGHFAFQKLNLKGQNFHEEFYQAFIKYNHFEQAKDVLLTLLNLKKYHKVSTLVTGLFTKASDENRDQIFKLAHEIACQLATRHQYPFARDIAKALYGNEKSSQSIKDIISFMDGKSPEYNDLNNILQFEQVRI